MHFFETELQSLMMHKKTISSNLNQKTNEKLRTIGKNTKIGLAYVQSYKAKLHRDWKRRWVYEISRENYKKSRNMRHFWTSNAFSGSAKHCGINFRGLHFNVASNEIYFYKKKNQITSKKMGRLDERLSI